MSHLKYLFYFIILHLNIAIPQLNLHYTDWVSEKDNISAHTCLRIVDYNLYGYNVREIMSYCMNELSSKFNIQNDNRFPTFTFAELSKQNITSQQLYLWSTPIDLIERYQFYLNQLSTTNDSLLGKQVFYNCTLPRFGPMCQYELTYYYSHHSSLKEIIQDFYANSYMNPTNLTCYTHLECNRGSSSLCLDWSEICDGRTDCLNDGIDEEHCWQLEINECQDNEYRCHNGQCIPQSFYRDNPAIPDCIDASDETAFSLYPSEHCLRYSDAPVGCEDRTCVFIPLTSSCNQKRSNLLMEIIYSNSDHSVSQDCWSAFKCLIKFLPPEYSTCDEFCKRNDCKNIIMNNCPKDLFFPNLPVLFANVYFAYRKKDLNSSADFSNAPLYICYNTSDYNEFFINISKISINNITCVYSKSFLPSSIFSSFSAKTLHMDIIHELYKLLKRYHLPFNYISTICNRSNMYQCLHSSKCISIHRLMDNIIDCPYMDDENISALSNTNVIEQFKKTYFKCQISNKYIHQSLVENGNCDCGKSEPEWCEDEDLTITHLKTNIRFQHICDGFIDLLPIMITGQNETDETECEQWSCNNIYTRCNHVWNCPNGVDESGCYLSPSSNCPLGYHRCVLPHSNQLMCLSIEKTNDGNIDCLGATDEPKLCKTSILTNFQGISYDFHCMNHSSHLCLSNLQLCDGYEQCEIGDDEQFCTTNQISSEGKGVCISYNYNKASEIERFLCDNQAPVRSWNIIHFKIPETGNRVEDPKANIQNRILSSSSIIQMSKQHQVHCHRGLDLRVWLNNEKRLTTDTCLCPLSYYGNQCQYQNQRISLTLQFRALSDSWQTLFTIIVSLIDDSDQRIIHSYEQFTYLSVRDCKRKFNIYLLYSTRPKDSTNNYSIHIDIYEKILLIYRGSVLFPVTFPFLPVHRLAFMVNIPSNENNNIRSCPLNQCIHGKCIRYSNNPQTPTFCQCNEGWSGRYCTIRHTCTCSSDSLCIGISANNRSICVCPLHKFGPRCLLTDTTCKNNNNFICENGGQCILDDDYLITHQKFTCICPQGYSGHRCEITETQLILSFDKDIVLSQSIFTHFIEVDVFKPLNFSESILRTTTFQTIFVRQDSVTIYWPRPFDLVLTELSDKKKYYVAVVQRISNRSTTINKTIYPSDHCPNISELFNQTFLQWHLIRRIKYYHLPCQNQSLNLSCFYDEIHLCLCYDFEHQRLANCFKFDHNMTFDCFGQNGCENGGQCLQDKLDCATRSICICPPCYYGRRCQFSANGFGLSLDAILGYHIIPNHGLTQQLSIIKISVALILIFMLTGLINGILCLMTFKNKIVREVGCGLYLLGSSITTLFTTTIFGLKFLILLLAQMSIISNRTFLQVQCHSIDCLLRICLCMDQWLNACVALERTITVIKATTFDKKKSKRTAKLVIFILLVIIIATSIHDPIYRRLIDEENDVGNLKRTWCIIKHPSGLEIYNYIIHIFHFFGPFLINLFSAIILITKKSHQQATIHTNRPYQEILREQFLEHKRLLTAPIVLVILALPRLIITFISKCMKSANDVWLYLIGYFISFIPPMLTFIVFIVPSTFYKTEFRKSMDHYRAEIQRHLPFTKTE